MHWEDFGRIPPQGVPQTDGTATTEGTRWYVGLSPSGGDDGEGKIIGGGYLHLLPPENSFTVHCDQAHYGTVFGRRETPEDKCVQELVGVGGPGFGGDVDGGSGGGTGGEGGAVPIQYHRLGEH